MGDDGYAAGAGDVAALLDRSVRWKAFNSAIQGVVCPKCGTNIDWKSLLHPDGASVPAEGSTAKNGRGPFRCSDTNCDACIHPKVAQNMFSLRLRALLKEHMEGWVECADDACIGSAKTRRRHYGPNVLSERRMLQELEYMQHLSEAAERFVRVAALETLEVNATGGVNTESAIEAAKGMQTVSKLLLDCNGYNWIDCGQLFGSIFGAKQ